jgi:hypothetical protein
MTVNFESLPQAVQELNAKMDNIMMFLQLAKPDVKTNWSPHIRAASFLDLSKHTLYNKVLEMNSTHEKS